MRQFLSYPTTILNLILAATVFTCNFPAFLLCVVWPLHPWLTFAHAAIFVVSLVVTLDNAIRLLAYHRIPVADTSPPPEPIQHPLSSDATADDQHVSPPDTDCSDAGFAERLVRLELWATNPSSHSDDEIVLHSFFLATDLVAAGHETAQLTSILNRHRPHLIDRLLGHLGHTPS